MKDRIANLLQDGQTATRAGQRARARRKFRAVLIFDPTKVGRLDERRSKFISGRRLRMNSDGQVHMCTATTLYIGSGCWCPLISTTPAGCASMRSCTSL